MQQPTRTHTQLAWETQGRKKTPSGVQALCSQDSFASVLFASIPTASWLWGDTKEFWSVEMESHWKKNIMSRQILATEEWKETTNYSLLESRKQCGADSKDLYMILVVLKPQLNIYITSVEQSGMEWMQAKCDKYKYVSARQEAICSGHSSSPLAIVHTEKEEFSWADGLQRISISLQ